MTAADLVIWKSSLTTLNANGATFRNGMVGQTIKVAGSDATAVVSGPRLSSTTEENGIRVDRYNATVRILKAAVPSITKLADWSNDGITIQLAEGATWRSYRIIDQPTDVAQSLEWKLEIESV